MTMLMLIAMSLSSPPGIGVLDASTLRIARALPCAPRFLPMAARIAIEPRRSPERQVQRFDLVRRPCFRRASA